MTNYKYVPYMGDSNSSVKLGGYSRSNSTVINHSRKPNFRHSKEKENKRKYYFYRNGHLSHKVKWKKYKHSRVYRIHFKNTNGFDLTKVYYLDMNNCLIKSVTYSSRFIKTSRMTLIKDYTYNNLYECITKCTAYFNQFKPKGCEYYKYIKRED